jgi:hypothetical protein
MTPAEKQPSTSENDTLLMMPHTKCEDEKGKKSKRTKSRSTGFVDEEMMGPILRRNKVSENG